MTLIQSIILGIIQGVAEFLPISSSGHLAILQFYFSINEGNLFYSIMLHLSTGLAVIIVLRKDIVELIRAFFNVIINLFKKGKLQFKTKYERLMLLIVIGSIPTAIIGILFEDYFEKSYQSINIIAIALIITGILLFISDKYSNSKFGIEKMSIGKGIIVGVFQGFAIMPGISRSGSTIVGALLMGLNKKDAARFSFLLSLPAVFGAALLQFLKLGSGEVVFNFNIIIGMVVSFIFGVISLKALLKIIQKGKLIYFSVYVWIVGLAILIFS